MCDNKWEVNSDGLKLPTFRLGSYVWSPAPCAGEAAIEELRRSWHKRQQSHHLFTIPRLMQPLWCKHLHKTADLILSLKPGHEALPIHMHEPLTIAFIFLFIRQKPWQLCGSAQFMIMGRYMSGVWAEVARREGPILWDLWSYQKQLEEMPPKLVPECYKASKLTLFHIATPENNKGSKWKNKRKEEAQFTSTRKGDMLCAPFQCDYCWFANMHKSEANPWFPEDARKLAYICRVNFDIMWAREPLTVRNTLTTLNKARKFSKELSFDPVMIQTGPWPIADTCRFQVAIEMI